MEVLPVDPCSTSVRNLLLNSIIDLLFCALLKTKALTMVSPLVGGEREGEWRKRRELMQWKKSVSKVPL